MNEGKQASRHDGKQRHRLGAPVHGGSPPCSKQVQDRGDQRPGVCDTHPENEVRDIDAPHHGMHQARDSHAGLELIQPAAKPDPDNHHQERDDQVVRDPRRAQGRENIATDSAVVGRRAHASAMRRTMRRRYVMAGCVFSSPSTAYPRGSRANVATRLSGSFRSPKTIA